MEPRETVPGDVRHLRSWSGQEAGGQGHLVGDDPEEEGHQLLRVCFPGGRVPGQWLSVSGRQQGIKYLLLT